MCKDITSLDKECINSTIKRIKELGRVGETEVSGIHKTFELVDSRYREKITNAFDGLRDIDKELIGDLLAICKKSDADLGRPLEDCEEEEKLYVITLPSRESIISGKDIGGLETNYDVEFVSIRFLVEQIALCDFTYIQIALSSEVQVFNGYYNVIASLLRELDKEKDNEIYTRFVVTKAINKAKLDMDIRNIKDINNYNANSKRAFHAYSVLKLAETYLDDKILSFCKNSTKLDMKVYNKYIKQIGASKEYLESMIKTLENKVEKLLEVDKNKIKVIGLNIEVRVLDNIISEILLNK